MKLSYLVAALIVLGVSTQALADPYNYPYNRGYDRNWQDRGWRDHGRDNDGRWIAPLIGGVILGAIIVNSNRREDSRRSDGDRVYRQPAPREYIYDPRCDCYR